MCFYRFREILLDLVRQSRQLLSRFHIFKNRLAGKSKITFARIEYVENYNLVVRGLDILLQKGVYIFAMTAD